MNTVATRARGWVAGQERKLALVIGLIAFALLYPSIVESLQDLPLVGDFVPSVGSVVVMIAFTTMAIGLNIVVGYAGLLDLGYVAFYAAGAYTAGWFASQQRSTSARSGSRAPCPASISRCGSSC
jgi:ABC-type branched-subunit amino acid transport system permease subunit